MNRTIAISSIAAASALTVMLYLGMQSSGGQQLASSPPEPAFVVGKYVDKDGTIRLPENYRWEWAHLGSWYVEDQKGGPVNVHDVYAEPEAVVSFRTNGKWPQGATIVKEVRISQKGKMTTGKIHWDGPITQWFVMVKDNNHTFAGNPNWGRGWGWALYSSNDPKKNVSTDFKTDCISCHVPAEKTDWIYTQGYPTLHEKEGPFKKYPKENYSGNDLSHEAVNK